MRQRSCSGNVSRGVLNAAALPPCPPEGCAQCVQQGPIPSSRCPSGRRWSFGASSSVFLFVQREERFQCLRSPMSSEGDSGTETYFSGRAFAWGRECIGAPGGPCTRRRNKQGFPLRYHRRWLSSCTPCLCLFCTWWVFSPAFSGSLSPLTLGCALGFTE